MLKKGGYNPEHQFTQRCSAMPVQKFDELTDFGKRLSRLRKTAGYTQVELAAELDVTQRMISYYEGHSEFPPSPMLPKLARLLNVSADELLGIQTI